MILLPYILYVMCSTTLCLGQLLTQQQNEVLLSATEVLVQGWDAAQSDVTKSENVREKQTLWSKVIPASAFVSPQAMQ